MSSENDYKVLQKKKTTNEMRDQSFFFKKIINLLDCF